MMYFTGDDHFGHENVIEHDHRPFSSVEEMDEALIDNWNSVVGPNDDVWHVGDLAYRCSRPVEEYLQALKGRIHIVWGNHDYHFARKIAYKFASCHELHSIQYNHQRIVLCHYPMRTWYARHYGSWQLHGHCHGKIPPLGLQMDVGVTCNNYKPVSFDEVQAYMSGRKDHAFNEQDSPSDPVGSSSGQL